MYFENKYGGEDINRKLSLAARLNDNYLDARGHRFKTVMSYPEGLKNLGWKLTGMALVIVLHILMIYALINWSKISILDYYLLPLEVNLIDEIKPTPRQEKPLPLKYLRAPSKVYVPQVSLPIATPIVPELAITADQGEVHRGGGDSFAGIAKEKGQMRPAQIDTKRPCPRPVYPTGSIPEEQQGTVVLKLLIGADGEVLESAVESSSGFPNLDEAARGALSRCLYKPAVNDRNLQQLWTIFKYRWRLE